MPSATMPSGACGKQPAKTRRKRHSERWGKSCLQRGVGAKEEKKARARLVTGEAKAISRWMGPTAFHQLRRSLKGGSWRVLGRRPILKRGTLETRAQHEEIGISIPSGEYGISALGADSHWGLGSRWRGGMFLDVIDVIHVEHADRDQEFDTCAPTRERI